MSVIQSLSAVALQPFVGDGAKLLINCLGDHFTDHGRRVLDALSAANERAWRALEVALAGDSWWEQIQGGLSRQEDRAFGLQIRAFLDAAALPELASKVRFRQACLEELSRAREAGLLAPAGLDPSALSGVLQITSRADPQALLSQH